MDVPDPPPPPPPEAAAATAAEAEARGIVEAVLVLELVRERSSRSEITEKGRRQMRPSESRKAKWEGPT